ncbi:acyl carrier protein, mitochondrial [[Candida] jaroonii]|uniref:Acyl carrier protein, mitochondrial n=1 Tax=[Candida] jaroonii TaxID=467808 RepID=A0ACA9Y2C0_9ASCO|nr:acyl carrier protein, mitochondrial [[Candida] jaroonii]
MFRNLIKSLPKSTVRLSNYRVNVPQQVFPTISYNNVRFYSAFPDLTREIAKERIYELLEGYDKVSTTKEITDDSSFIQDLGLDSLDVVEVVMELEHEFNIQIPDDEADSLKTVGQTIDYILAQPDAC